MDKLVVHKRAAKYLRKLPSEQKEKVKGLFPPYPFLTSQPPRLLPPSFLASQPFPLLDLKALSQLSYLPNLFL